MADEVGQALDSAVEGLETVTNISKMIPARKEINLKKVESDASAEAGEPAKKGANATTKEGDAKPKAEAKGDAKADAKPDAKKDEKKADAKKDEKKADAKKEEKKAEAPKEAAAQLPVEAP